MKVVIYYTRNTPDDRYIDHLKEQLEGTGKNVELVDADSRDGAAQCVVYDIVARPAVVVSDDRGSALQVWQGTLPSVDEVGAYYGF